MIGDTLMLILTIEVKFKKQDVDFDMTLVMLL